MDLVFDIASSFLGIVFLLLGLIFIPELKKIKILIFVLCLIMLVFGIEKLLRDRRTSERHQIQRIKDSTSIVNLQLSIDDLSAKYRSDTIAQAAFLKELKEKYGIIKDPESKKPIINNTNINHANLVQIGGQYN